MSEHPKVSASQVGDKLFIANGVDSLRYVDLTNNKVVQYKQVRPYRQRVTHNRVIRTLYRILFKLHLRNSYPIYLQTAGGSKKFDANILRTTAGSSDIRPPVHTHDWIFKDRKPYRDEQRNDYMLEIYVCTCGTSRSERIPCRTEVLPL